jgi:prevent-host-death family protein
MADETINIHAAKTRLSQLVARAERGERITIARDGRPVAELGPTRRRGRKASVTDDDPLLNLATFALDGPPPSRPLTNEEIDETIYGR